MNLRARDQIDYSEYYQSLLKRRDEILGRDENMRAQVEQQRITGEAPGDEADISLIDANADYFLLLADRDRQELLKIRSALEKLHHGTYGVCENCGSPIATERLRHLPYAQFCQECQASFEARQKVENPGARPKL